MEPADEPPTHTPEQLDAARARPLPSADPRVAFHMPPRRAAPPPERSAHAHAPGPAVPLDASGASLPTLSASPQIAGQSVERERPRDAAATGGTGSSVATLGALVALAFAALWWWRRRAA